ncbi:hypothetical protein ZWY2020_050630, partial [Hordeum vulgare]
FALDAGTALLTSPADREEWHDCVPEFGDNFSDLEELQVVRVQGADRSDRAIIRVVGKFFPDAPNPFSSLPPFFSLVWYTIWKIKEKGKN